MTWLARTPFFVVLMGFGAVSMLVPAVHGWALSDHQTMRVFFYGFILFSILTLVIGLATAGYAPRSVARSQLVALLAAFTGLPLMFAIPFQEALGNTSFLNAWFEMVSSLTTTGATVYDNAGRLTPTPVYAAFTFVLWVGLVTLGEVPYVALIHAMSVLSTSGITPVGGLYYAASGFWGEVLIFAFFVLAISRLSFSPGLLGENDKGLLRDPEFRIALILIGTVTGVMFLRHYVGALSEENPATFAQMMRAIWGAIFTVTSFLTTTGFESRDWLDAADWSGLETPGLLLVGMSLIGGGVATTAGGVKLLRIYALYRHSEREMQRLVQADPCGGDGLGAVGNAGDYRAVQS